jgi:hypothetical protein
MLEFSSCIALMTYQQSSIFRGGITNDSSWAFFENSPKIYDDSHISYVDTKGAIGVKKKKIPFTRERERPWMPMFPCLDRQIIV